MPYVKDVSEGVQISVRARPRASRAGIDGPLGDALAVRVRAAPVDGKANKELIETIAKAFGLSKSAVSLAGGDTGRNKRFLLRGIDADGVRAKVAAAAK